MNKWIFSILVIAFTTLSVNATVKQSEESISGVVCDETGNPLEGAYIYIAVDSIFDNIIASTLSDETGKFHLTASAGCNVLKISCLGYNVTTSKFELLENEHKNLGKCILTVNPHELQTVVVNGNQINVKQLADGFTVNVERIAQSSNNALDLLGRLPQINVQGNKINVIGKEKILLRINNVMQRVDAGALADVLRGYDATLIKSVDVITSPSLKYDKNGTTAVIVLHMSSKFNKYAGGSIGTEIMKGANFNGRYGVYGSGVFNNDKLFIDLTPSYNHTYSYVREQSSYLMDNGAQYSNNAPSRGKSNYVGSYFTLQYQYSKKGYVGLSTNVNKRNTYNDFLSEESFNTYNTLNINDVAIKEPKMNLTVYAEHNFSPAFIGWLEGSYYNYKENTDTYFEGLENIESEPFMSYNSNEDLRVSGMNICNNYYLELDSRKRYALEFGATFYYSQTHNNRDYREDNLVSFPNGPFYQADKIYIDEYKYAPYASLRFTPNDKVSLRVGVDLSHTNRTMHNQDGDDNTLKVDYTSVLPDLLASWRPNQNSRLVFNVQSGSVEPQFAQINPFTWRTNQNSYFGGNPNLVSERRYTYRLTYTYKGAFSITAYANQKNNEIANIAKVVDNTIITTPENAQKSTDFRITPSYYFDRLRWFEMSVQGYYAYTISKGLIPGLAARTTASSWGAYLYTGFIFNRQRTCTGYFTANLTGNRKTSVSTLDPSYRFGAGISYFLCNRNLVLSVAGINLFASRYKGVSKRDNYTIHFNNRFDYPTLYVSLSYTMIR